MDQYTQILCEKYADNMGVVRFVNLREIDGSNYQKVADELTSLVKKEYVIKMVIDFDRIRFLCSAMLGKLVSLKKKIDEEKGQLKLCNMTENVLEIFKITKLEKIFEIYNTEDEAIDSFKKFGLGGQASRFFRR